MKGGTSKGFEDTVKNLLRMKPKPHVDRGEENDKKKGRDEPAPSEANRSSGD